MTERVLITGGFGYLGSRIAVALANEAGYKIRLGSRKPQLPPPWLLAAETATMDLLDAASLSAALKDVQIVVHLAAMNEQECQLDPEKALLVNGLGTLKLLTAAKDAGVQRFIYLSTAHVYGAPLSGHITEKTLPRPINPYAISHHVAEDFVLKAHDKQELMGIVLRLSNSFGAPRHPSVDRWAILVVNDLCRQVIQTGEMVLRSSGLQQRNFIPLDDVERALQHVLSWDQKRCGDGLYNLGGDFSLSIWELTQRIAARCRIVLGITPTTSRLPPDPLEEQKVVDLVYDSSKIKQTGLRLSSRIDEAIDETLCLMANFITPGKLQ